MRQNRNPEFRNRYFDQQTGRFITADPLGYRDGPNRYQGFLNSPLNYSDPLGTDAFVVRLGPGENDFDVYVTVRFLRRDKDLHMTDEMFYSAQEEFIRSGREVWSALRPQVLVDESASISSNRMYVFYPEKSPFVRDIVLDSREGHTKAGYFWLDRISPYTIPHEFGHHLGLDEQYRRGDVITPNGRVRLQTVPDVEQFGPRARTSIMGNRHADGPNVFDIADVLDSEPSLATKIPFDKAPVHHVDLSVAGLVQGVAFFEKVAEQRGRDVSTQLQKLRSSESAEQRRVIVRWLMNALFRP